MQTTEYARTKICCLRCCTSCSPSCTFRSISATRSLISAICRSHSLICFFSSFKNEKLLEESESTAIITIEIFFQSSCRRVFFKGLRALPCYSCSYIACRFSHFDVETKSRRNRRIHPVSKYQETASDKPRCQHPRHWQLHEHVSTIWKRYNETVIARCKIMSLYGFSSVFKKSELIVHCPLSEGWKQRPIGDGYANLRQTPKQLCEYFRVAGTNTCQSLMSLRKTAGKKRKLLLKNDRWHVSDTRLASSAPLSNRNMLTTAITALLVSSQLRPPELRGFTLLISPFLLKVSILQQGRN